MVFKRSLPHIMEFIDEPRKSLFQSKPPNRIPPLMIATPQKRLIYHRSSNSTIEKLNKPIKHQELMRLLQPPPTYQQKKLPPFSASKIPSLQSPANIEFTKPLPPSNSHKQISSVLHALIQNKKLTLKLNTRRMPVLPRREAGNAGEKVRAQDLAATKQQRAAGRRKPQTAATSRPDSRYKHMFGGMENGRESAEYKVPILRMNLGGSKELHVLLPECWS